MAYKFYAETENAMRHGIDDKKMRWIKKLGNIQKLKTLLQPRLAAPKQDQPAGTDNETTGDQEIVLTEEQEDSPLEEELKEKECEKSSEDEKDPESEDTSVARTRTSPLTQDQPATT